MKRVVRTNVFETNSSSCHSLTLMDKNVYDRWKEDNNLLMRKAWSFKDGDKIEFENRDKIVAGYKERNPDIDFDSDPELLEDWLRDDEWFTYEKYWDYWMERFEGFEETYTTPSGDKVVAFGYYGNDY